MTLKESIAKILFRKMNGARANWRLAPVATRRLYREDADAVLAEIAKWQRKPAESDAKTYPG